jgi:hypothetical protein
VPLRVACCTNLRDLCPHHYGIRNRSQVQTGHLAKLGGMKDLECAERTFEDFQQQQPIRIRVRDMNLREPTETVAPGALNANVSSDGSSTSALIAKITSASRAIDFMAMDGEGPNLIYKSQPIGNA